MSANPTGSAVDLTVVDPAVLARRCSGVAEQVGFESVQDVERVLAGASSLTFRATATATGQRQGIILKVAPPGLAPVRNRDVLRQAKALKAMASISGVRVPTVLFEDAGNPPETPPLFAMSMEPGECAEPIFAGQVLPPPEDIHGRARSAARMLGSLHRARPSDLGLGGETPVSLDEEVARWNKAFTTVEESLRGRSDEATELLLRAVPAAAPEVLLHGDYRLGNMLCEDQRVTAIIDWELWSVSDPRLDLAWLLLHRDPRRNPHAGREAPGMPSAQELVDEYTQAAGLPAPELDWFSAMVRYKQAAAGALLLKRSAVPHEDPRRRESARRLRAEIDDAIDILTYGY